MGSSYIIIVDDHAGIRQLLCEILTEKGHSVETASNGRDAVNKIISGNTPDLVFLDLKMPGLSGMEVFYEIRSIYSAIPVIILSAYNEMDLIKKDMTDTHNLYFLKKPFDIYTMLNLVKTILKDI